ncbi:succinate dehydrogenase assembly factor 2 [Roseateles sp.]|uniref:FAD assembly factor SdhE n=1 Tax=Roseateles sp. TaxID=1971397 RepID=UPI00394BBF6D
MPELIGERELSKLRWRCRRGLLENDLLIARFFEHHPDGISLTQAEGLTILMDLADNDLLDLLLRRKEPSGDLDCPAVQQVLGELRTPESLTL